MISERARKWLILDSNADEDSYKFLTSLHRPAFVTLLKDFTQEPWKLATAQLCGAVIVFLTKVSYEEELIEQLLNKLNKSVLPNTQIELYMLGEAAERIDLETLICFAGFVDAMKMIVDAQNNIKWSFKAASFDPSVPSVIQPDNSLQDCKVTVAAPTQRKPCANCTCGRKEGGVVKSACGSCHLGDEFRCSSCPYLGQPAFDKSDPSKIKLVL